MSNFFDACKLFFKDILNQATTTEIDIIFLNNNMQALTFLANDESDERERIIDL